MKTIKEAAVNDTVGSINDFLLLESILSECASTDLGELCCTGRTGNKDEIN